MTGVPRCVVALREYLAWNPFTVEPMLRWYWVLLLLVLVGAWRSFEQRPIERLPGELAAADPIQQRLDEAHAFETRGYALSARAQFTLTARVLATERYRLDGMADIVPYDLALGWGLMSDSSVLDRITVTQGNRFYYWRTGDDTLPLREVARHSANMHLIAADDTVAAAIARTRIGHVVTIRGLLVDVRRPDGGVMHTSMSRDDTGPGACEIIWAESFAVE